MPPRSVGLSRFWRLTPLIALTTAVAVLGIGVALVLYLDHAYEAQKASEITVQADILAATVPAALSFNDRRAGQEYVDALAANPEIEVVAVHDANGELFVSYRRGETVDVPNAVAPHPAKFVDDRLVVVTSVVQAGDYLGTVYLRSFTEPLAHRMERYGIIGLLIVMTSIVVAVLGISQRALARANLELGRQAEALAETNDTLRAQIEQREKAEAALRQAQKMEAIGQLTGGIAHDFNNLLQVIIGNLERLRRRMPGDADSAEVRLIDAAGRGADRAAVLTRRLLAFSRRQALAPTVIDVNKLVGGMSDLLLRTLGETIQVETRLSGGLWRISADENQLENALLNLAVNARDAMQGGGRLLIATENVQLPADSATADEEVLPGDYVQLAVTDTGTGMTADVLAKAFDPFFTTKDIGQGTGLGLSQVYGFVRQSGGHVRMESAPGRGTTVRLYLPRLPASPAMAEPVREAAAPPVPRGRDGETILVVEDEPDVRSATVEMLRDLGYAVVDAPEARTALQRLKGAERVDLLITDVGLPGGMNGRELAEAALALRPRLRVVFITGYARDAFSRDRGVPPRAEILTKPFSDVALATRVRAVLDARASGTA